MDLTRLFAGQREMPAVTKTRREPRVRSLRVQRIERITPAMLRLTLAGDDLADFESLGFDDHVKLLLPGGARRDYTPRRFDREARTLAIDFAVHDAGPATGWAVNARVGDPIDIAGPKSSSVVPTIVRRLLIGDETALPAIGRGIEELAPGTSATAVLAVVGQREEQHFETVAELTCRWTHRPLASAATPDALLRVLADVEIAPETFVWVAAEAATARAIRDYLVGERAVPRNWIKAGGYWVAGRADAHERIG